DLRGNLPEVDGAELPFNVLHAQAEPPGLYGIDADQQIRVACENAAVDLLEAASLAAFLELLGNLLGFVAQYLVIRPEQLDLNWPIRAGQVVQLVLHDLEQLELELMLVVVIP